MASEEAQSAMCGITGVIYRDGRHADPELVRSMASTIAHRGPDGQGVHVFAGGGFGHRRLAILDLSEDGAQPMSAGDGAVWIVFNGEIYNFQELRRELEQLGHRFRSRSDTEVILEAWLEWGERSIARLDGMFAIALWDTRTRQLLLARDRTGKKPLYVYEDSQKLVFGSEIKAILAHPEINTREWPEAAGQFLSHGYVPTPHTFYAQIRKVKPSHYEVLDFGKRETREHQYWEFPLGRERRVKTEDDWREVEHDVRRLFLAAVKRRMVADVPVGAFLSGGIDSSLVVAAMAESSSRPVLTFSIGFEGAPEFDETRYARMVAERFGTRHTEFRVKAEAFDLSEKLAWHFDEPFGDSSCIPTFIVSKLTREAGCSVALTGDGGDEAFAGYPRFAAAAAAERIPRALRRIVGSMTSTADERPGNTAPWWRAHRFANRATLDLPDRLRSWVTLYGADELQQREDIPFAPSPSILGERYRHLFEKAAGLGADPLNQILFVNARTYLLDDLNVKVDRAAMAASLECRSPFLDTALLEYAFSLPAHTKIHGLERKYALKRAHGDLLVPAAANRPKMGFGVPMGTWLLEREGATVNGRAMEAWADLQLRRWSNKLPSAVQGTPYASEGQRETLMAFTTPQEEFWAGDFGSNYNARNASESLLAANIAMFSRALQRASGITSVIELGANIGMNLRALRTLLPQATLHAVEINHDACVELGKLGYVNATEGSLLGFRPKATVELAFVKGVLIHIAPDKLPEAYDALANSTHRYALIGEYYNPSPVTVPYRGHADRLFKRDFAGEFMERHSAFKLVDYGFCYRRDPLFPQDDITWFLLEKR